MVAWSGTSTEPMYFNVGPSLEEHRKQESERRQRRGMRMRSLRHEIQVAKFRRREYDHLQAELRSCEREIVEELKEETRR